MGASKDGGYVKQDVLSGTGNKALEKLLQNALKGLSSQGNISQDPLYQQAVEGTQQFLPGGQGFAPIQQQAQQNFQQQTIPSILNSFGSGSKGSSALNQALAGAGSNLNTNLASQLAQMQLGASGQAGQLAQLPGQQSMQQAQLGLGTAPFAYQQKQSPFWQDMILALTNAAGQAAKSFAGAV